ncbi:iron-containing alcohol dehydrogenase [Alcanivorax hongdengensis A-11-3]|uniref:Iron-containing alcohol dehydrogenase n=1 Tax=Alcanivorax hongdengensis A-11-3 TaxID=1177179 RepID=L0WG55_9GAMM|nr:iron-containing alcohol dehydrogenase [Alcanivorax hongdengensis]EKF75137.1 iron-containing alcohol dehydrogenase [Alcanivorax hongdengensis A-11-3]
MAGFEFATTHRVLVEAGAAGRLPELSRQLGANRVLLVTDPGIRRTPLLEPVIRAFEQAGMPLHVFDQVSADPADTVVQAALQQAGAVQADLVIGFGGGSSMDVAKLVALLADPRSHQALEEIYGVGVAEGPRLPLIQVPTTAGTGSEVTPVAIVTTGATTKAGVVSPVLLPDLAVLDAELTLGLPAPVTAATGIDAMVHAIEAYTSAHKKNPYSDMLAREALRLLAGNLSEAVHNGSNTAAREACLLGAMMAGQAFANAPVAAVHALAYPLGGHFHIPHGLSNSLVLPEVLRFNAPQAAALYAELAPILSDEPFSTAEQGAATLIDALDALIADVQLPVRLRDAGVTEDSLETLAADAMLQQRLLVNNPREVSEADALAIYKAVY